MLQVFIPNRRPFVNENAILSASGTVPPAAHRFVHDDVAGRASHIIMHFSEAPQVLKRIERKSRIATPQSVVF